MTKDNATGTRMYVGRNDKGERMLIAYLDPVTYARAYRLFMRREDELTEAIKDAINTLVLPEEITTNA